MLARAGWCEVSREVSSTGSAADEGVQGEILTLTLTLTPTLTLALALALTLALAVAVALPLALALALPLTFSSISSSFWPRSSSSSMFSAIMPLTSSTCSGFG